MRCNSPASRRTLFAVHRNGDSGSPRVTGSISRLAQQSPILGDGLFPTPTRPTNPLAQPQNTGLLLQFPSPDSNGSSRHAGGASHDRGAPESQGRGFCSSYQPPHPFIEMSADQPKALSDRPLVYHYRDNIHGLSH
jgi:hypothetical protein